MKIDILMKIGLGFAVFIVLILISIPSFALSMNPSDTQNIQQERDPTPEELNEQMALPKVIDDGSGYHEESYEKTDIKVPENASSEPESVKAALAESEKRTGISDRKNIEKKARKLFGIAVAFAIVGLLCIGAVILVKKGPQPPKV